MNRQVSGRSGGEYQADEQAGLTRDRKSTRLNSSHTTVIAYAVFCLGKCRGAQLASIRQMSRQLFGGSAGECQADEQAGVARLCW